MTDFFDIAATPSVLATQERKGAAGLYVTEVGAGPGELHTLDAHEIEFLTSRDSFYIASVGETGWPYVQHRGGDAGFIKVLDDHTIGWVERSGNRQYVGTGNMNDNGRVALILVDYPSRSRIKIYGRATHHAEASSELLDALDAHHLRNDGAITVEILSTAWNCPKYITPRYTEEQIAPTINELHARIAELETQLEARS
ncbi:MAG: putative pyridoxine 5'-phosphate oxidase superfamily flavin-nucleotide-binding protein [Candidatus Aldehydirespiratoraceae bacterium]|jgi:predicted pyridoxine 5'-phosphate oxidase superfamily flavin-nucleotide-binding protein